MLTETNITSISFEGMYLLIYSPTNAGICGISFFSIKVRIKLYHVVMQCVEGSYYN